VSCGIALSDDSTLEITCKGKQPWPSLMLPCLSGICFEAVLKVRETQNQIIAEAAEIGTGQLPLAGQKRYLLSQLVWLDQSVIIHKQGIKY